MTYIFLSLYLLSYLSFITPPIVAISQVKSTVAFKKLPNRIYHRSSYSWMNENINHNVEVEMKLKMNFAYHTKYKFEFEFGWCIPTSNLEI